MDLNSNYRLIQNKVNVYNLPNFKNFVNDPQQVGIMLNELNQDYQTFGDYNTRVSGFVQSDFARYGKTISPITR